MPVVARTRLVLLVERRGVQGGFQESVQWFLPLGEALSLAITPDQAASLMLRGASVSVKQSEGHLDNRDVVDLASFVTLTMDEFDALLKAPQKELVLDKAGGGA